MGVTTGSVGFVAGAVACVDSVVGAVVGSVAVVGFVELLFPLSKETLSKQTYHCRKCLPSGKGYGTIKKHSISVFVEAA